MSHWQLNEGLGWGPGIFCLNWIAIPCFVLLSLLSGAVLSEIRFQEVTGSAGIAYFGQSYGASWGDFDGDGLTDLWVNNHLRRPDLYHNNGDGTFTDILLDVWSGNPTDDAHGAAWGDFDNDGDQDLMELVGAQAGQGQGPNHLYVNEGGVLIDMATALGVDYPLARGRTPSWLDWNNDGLLDLVLSSNRRPADEQAPSALFEQIAGGFQNVNDTVGFAAPWPSNFTQLAEFTGDGVLDLVVHGVNYPQRVYDITQQPFVDVRSVLGLPAVTDVWDAAVADVNGDLRTDLFLTRVVDGRAASDVFQESDVSIKVRLRALRSDEQGIHFRSAGDVTFDLYGPPESNIFIGESGQNPPATTFTLSASDPSVWGIQPHVAGSDTGSYIGYDPATQVWQWVHSRPTGFELSGIIQTVMPATEVTAIGFDPDSLPLIDRLLIQTASGFQDQTMAAGFDVPTPCYSVAAGDLDNDMDVDLYLVCNRPTANLPNILYENLGNGDFVAVANAGGAAGSALGRGENVVLADYDSDGFLDLFVTNGMYSSPFNNGPQQLFRNEGNANHWIEIDLEGSVSNRDGIGAQVLVSAGGVTQLRTREGGMHRHAQNDKRIHFGLGGNTSVDMIEVRWPSGTLQVLENVDVDQIMSIQEDIVTVSIDDVIVDERAGTAEFIVNLSRAPEEAVSVDYSTVNGSAWSGIDYGAASGTLVFLPGQTRKTIVVDIVADQVPEFDETFTLRLDNLVNSQVEKAVATATITRSSIWFEDVTAEAGVSYSGQSVGASWGDYDGNQCPDFWVGNHYEHPGLYVNQCDGTFIDIGATITVDPSKHDSHGAAWADIDNDGLQDLFVASGDHLNHLYMNRNGSLVDTAQAAGVEGCPQTNDPCQLTRARTPLWLDWNNDGILDLVIAHTVFPATGPPTRLFEQQDHGFELQDTTTGFDVTAGATFAQLSDLSGDGTLDLLVNGWGAPRKFPRNIFEMGPAPLGDLTAVMSIAEITPVYESDIALADVDGNLLPDVVLARGTDRESDVAQTDAHTLHLRALQSNNESGVEFSGKNTVTFNILGGLSVSKIFLGQAGSHPLSSNFTVSPDDPAVQGIKSHTAGVSDGVYIGYDPDKSKWTLLRSYPGFQWDHMTISSSGAITDVTPLGFSDPVQSASLLLNQSGVIADASVESGIAIADNCVSVSAADFDNDMDVDLYLVCNSPVENTANMILSNDGSGHFTPVPQSGGAAGTVIGRGDSVAVADYDLDGFLDVLVTNADWFAAGKGYLKGPNQLFRNAGNSNHWLQIDLQGVISNRDGIGARVLVTTPDGKTQLREQQGGMHRYAQDYQRIHVGLGSNTSVSNISVRWPSGLVQDINNVSVDQILRIVEGETVNNVPSATSGGIIVFQNDTGSVQVSVDDPDVGEPHTYAVTQTGVLGGVSSVDAFGLVTYDATGATPGTENIEVTVTDQGGAGLSVTVSIPITVNAIGEADSNGDGVTDAQAIALGLDPTDADGDADNDGIPDANEIGDPDPAKAFDIDGDGIIDALEEGAKASDGSLASGLAVEDSDVEILSAGQVLSELAWRPVEDGPPGVSFPFGMISYKTTSPLGGNVIVRMTFSTPLPANLALYKVDNGGTFILLPSSIWKQVNSTTLDIILTDGDALTDLDGVANGEIIDPIAPAATSETITDTETTSETETTPTTSSGGGGGCTLNPGKERDATLPLLILIFVAYLMRRRIWLK